MKMTKWRSWAAGIVSACMIAAAPGALAAVPEPQPDVVRTFFDDSIANAWVQTFKDDLSADYVSQLVDKSTSHSGGASYRIKLQSAQARGKMLYVNWVDNGSIDMSGFDFANTFLELYYQPLLLRERVEVGFICGDNPYASLRADISGYVTLTDADVQSGKWQRIQIPLSDFRDPSKTVFEANGSGRTDFDWTKCKGFTIAGSDEGVPNQVNFCRIDDVTLGGAVAAPSNLQAEAGATTVSLSWSPPGGKAPDRYDIYRDGEQVASVTGTAYKDAGLMGSTAYQYQVQAVRGAGISQPADLAVQTKSYFEDIPDTGVYFSDMRFSIGGSPVSSLGKGELRIDGRLASVDYAGTARLMAVLRQGQELRQAVIGSAQTCVPGQAQSDSLLLKVPETAGASVEIFAWDAVGGMRLLTQICTLDGSGFHQTERTAGIHKTETADVKYDPTRRQLVLTVQAGKDANGYMTVLAVPAGADPEKTAPEEIACLACIPVADGVLAQTAVPVSAAAADGAYDVYLGADQAGVLVKKSFYFADQERLLGLLSAVNDPALTAAALQPVLEDPALCLELDDYGRIPASERATMLGWFLSWREAPMENPEQVQALLDRAAGLMLLTVENKAEQMDRWIRKYGALSGMTQEQTGAYEAAGSSLRARILSRLTSGKMEYERQEEPGADFLKKYETAYILASASDPEMSWKRLEELLTVTYSGLNLVDPGAVSQAGVSASAVYKAMIGREYYGLDEITAAYKKAVNDAKTLSPSRPIQSGGGGGGGGTGGGQSFQAPGTADSVPPVVEPQPEFRFADMDQAAWARTYVEQLTSRGIIARDTYFRPNDQIAREEFVKLAVEAFALLAPGAACGFSDVPRDSWYYPYVASAYQGGIVAGINDGQFGAGLSLTRQDAAVILNRLLPADPDAEAEARFTDDSQIAAYAKEAVYHMKRLGILNGRADGAFVPEDSLTRAEAAKMIFMTMQNQALETGE